MIDDIIPFSISIEPVTIAGAAVWALACIGVWLGFEIG